MSRVRALSNVLVVAAVFALRADGQEVETPRVTGDWIDEVVQQEALSRGVPGLGLAIVAKGDVVAERVYGLADIENGVPVKPTTAFNIASVSKPFSAMAVVRLARRQGIGLDASARALLPWLPATLSTVTIRQLLTHTSGIVRDVRTGNEDDPKAEEYRARIARAEPAAEPGARFEYSNTGYAVLGWAAEAAAGMSFERLLAREVFEVAGLSGARYRTPLAESDRAKPYRWVAGQLEPETYVSGGFASGGIVMSTRDFAAFGQALQDGRLLSAEERELVWSPGRLGDGREVRVALMTEDDSYGLGWFLTSFAGHRLVTHGGAIQGFSANLYHFPDDDLTLAVVANSKARDDGQSPVDLLARRLATRLLADNDREPEGEPDRAPSEAAVRPDDREAVRRAVLDYVEGVYQRDPARIERSVHSELAKLGFWRSSPRGSFSREAMTRAELLETARTYETSSQNSAEARKEIELLDVQERIAVAKLRAEWGIDYLHLAKFDESWQIVHVLWQGPP